MSSGGDAFAHLARYYDGIMEEINYDRWVVITSYLADLLPGTGVRHLDAGCGTGKLCKRLMTHGWNTCGSDLSWGMMRAGAAGGIRVPLAQADMRALPFEEGAFTFVTCVFDSLNFILEAEGVQRALGEFERVLAPGGVLYFDLVTERMVTEHFAGQEWTENNGRFSTTWSGTYDPKTGIADTTVRINTGESNHIVERVYPLTDIQRWTENAGLSILDAVDAETWGTLNSGTIRIDVVAMKAPERGAGKQFTQIAKGVAEALK